MQSTLLIKVFLLLSLFVLLAAVPGCDNLVRGGAEITLEGVSLGGLAMEGKPVQGLPTGKVDIILKVAANKVNISSIENTMVIKLAPSGAIITSGSAGLTITGVKPDQVEVKWQTAK